MSSLPEGPVTLATIAAKLGISRSTVSNAYNHPDQLSPALRQRIFDTAEQLGYTGPDPVARRLRKGRAGAIGVLFSEPLHYAFGDAASQLFLEGVARAGEEADSAMLLIPARPSEKSAEIVANAVVDGFLLYSIPPGHPFVEAAMRRRLPVVCIDQTKIGGVSWLGIDDRAAAREAANHLIGLGHRKIAIVVFGLGPNETVSQSEFPGEDESHASVSWLRLEGYGDALSAAGLSWVDVQVIEVERNTEAGASEAVKELLTGEDGPTAVLCTSDLLALGVVDAVQAAGKSVPEDLSVVGFNDLPAAERAGLTTVRQPLGEKGERAAKILFDGSHTKHESTHLEAELVIRTSTAAPK